MNLVHWFDRWNENQISLTKVEEERLNKPTLYDIWFSEILMPNAKLTHALPLPRRRSISVTLLHLIGWFGQLAQLQLTKKLSQFIKQLDLKLAVL